MDRFMEAVIRQEADAKRILSAGEAPKALVDLVANLMRVHGPDGHTDGAEVIAAGAWQWMKANSRPASE